MCAWSFEDHQFQHVARFDAPIERIFCPAISDRSVEQPKIWYDESRVISCLTIVQLFRLDLTLSAWWKSAFEFHTHVLRQSQWVIYRKRMTFAHCGQDIDLNLRYQACRRKATPVKVDYSKTWRIWLVINPLRDLEYCFTNGKHLIWLRSWHTESLTFESRQSSFILLRLFRNAFNSFIHLQIW